MYIQSEIPQHNQFTVKNKLSDNFTQNIIFNSNFDSGNLKSVERVQTNQFYLTTVPDGEFSNTDLPQKSWFHFSVQGFNPKQQVKFIIPGITMLQQVSKSPDFFKPVYKTQHGQWRKSNFQVVFQTKENNELELQFDFVFENDRPIFFAFSFPWTYTENLQFMKQLQQDYNNDKEIYFNYETIIKSPENRNIDLITISSQEGQTFEKEEYIDPLLFPEREDQQRAVRFRNNKMIVFFTGRVHPGETPASHSMNGIIKFLLSKNDARAQLLRKYFVFKIIPMLNPDGVYHGHYRFDIYGQNLNRYYDVPDPNKQPSCYAVRKIVEYLNQDKRVFFYSDLHSHPRKQGCFFYGNAVEDLPSQVEGQLYAKIVGMNCVNLEYENCNFSKKHMNAKDRNEDVTKQSCARVQVQKITGIIHCYTLENGYHQNNFISELAYPTNTHRKFGQYGYTEPDTENFQSDVYKRGPPAYTIPIYEQVGRAMLISILDVFDKNPYSRIPSSNYKAVDTLRRDLAIQVARQDRFKKDESIQPKIKNITNLIKESFFRQFKDKKVFDVADRGRSQQKRFTISKGKQSNITKIKSAKQIKLQKDLIQETYQNQQIQNQNITNQQQKGPKTTKMPKINKKSSKTQYINDTQQNTTSEVISFDKFQKGLKTKQNKNLPPKYNQKMKDEELFKDLDINNNIKKTQINIVNQSNPVKSKQNNNPINETKSPKIRDFVGLNNNNPSSAQNYKRNSKQQESEILDYHKNIFQQDIENIDRMAEKLYKQDTDADLKQRALVLHNINKQNPYNHGYNYAQQKMMKKISYNTNPQNKKFNNQKNRVLYNKTEQQRNASSNNEILELENFYNNEISSNITRKILDLEYGVDNDILGHSEQLIRIEPQIKSKKPSFIKSNSQQKKRNHEYLKPIQMNKSNLNNYLHYSKQQSLQGHDNQNNNINNDKKISAVEDLKFYSHHNNSNNYKNSYYNKNLNNVIIDKNKDLMANSSSKNYYNIYKDTKNNQIANEI